MKDLRKGVCPLCDHTEVLEAIPADFGNKDHERTAAVTYEPRWVLGGRNPNYPHGMLRVYVCRGCGYVQWFAENADAIPVGDRYLTRVINGPGTSDPYR